MKPFKKNSILLAILPLFRNAQPVLLDNILYGVAYPHPSGRELVTDEAVAKGGPVVIEPWGVVVVEEN